VSICNETGHQSKSILKQVLQTMKDIALNDYHIRSGKPESIFAFNPFVKLQNWSGLKILRCLEIEIFYDEFASNGSLVEYGTFKAFQIC